MSESRFAFSNRTGQQNGVITERGQVHLSMVDKKKNQRPVSEPVPVLPAPLCGIVFDGETGHLCGSNEALDSALLEVESAEGNRRMGRAARRWAEREIGAWDNCVGRYTRIYRQLLDGA